MSWTGKLIRRLFGVVFADPQGVRNCRRGVCVWRGVPFINAKRGNVNARLPIMFLCVSYRLLHHYLPVRLIHILSWQIDWLLPREPNASCQEFAGDKFHLFVLSISKSMFFPRLIIVCQVSSRKQAWLASSGVWEHEARVLWIMGSAGSGRSGVRRLVCAEAKVKGRGKGWGATTHDHQHHVFADVSWSLLICIFFLSPLKSLLANIRLIHISINFILFCSTFLFCCQEHIKSFWYTKLWIMGRHTWALSLLSHEKLSLWYNVDWSRWTDQLGARVLIIVRTLLS